MRNRGITLVEIMITLAIIVLLAIIVISGFLSTKIVANERKAEEVLRAITRGYESFAQKHDGSYNETLRNLASPALYTPPYIALDYTASPFSGYIFSCNANASGYICNARPQAYKETGMRSFSVCTKGLLREAAGDTPPPCP